MASEEASGGRSRQDDSVPGGRAACPQACLAIGERIMDTGTFDAAARAFAHRRSRRAVLATLGALALRSAPWSAAAAAPTGFTAAEIKVSTTYTGASANAI